MPVSRVRGEIFLFRRVVRSEAKIHVWGRADALEAFGQMHVFPLLKKRNAEDGKGVLCFWAPILDDLR